MTLHHIIIVQRASYGPLHMAEQKQSDQLEPTYSSSVRIRVVALRTYRKRWTMGRGGERKSEISVLMARQDEIMIYTYIYIYIYIYIYAFWLECSQIARETGVQNQVILKTQKWYLMPPCLTLSIIRYGSRVKWSNPGKGAAPSPTSCCSSYWKWSLRVAHDYGRQLYIYIYIYIYMTEAKQERHVIARLLWGLYLKYSKLEDKAISKPIYNYFVKFHSSLNVIFE